MNDKLKDIRGGYYPLGELGGEYRYLRFDLNAFAEMERIYGSMDAANNALSKGSMRDVRNVLWLGLIHDQAILDDFTGEPIKYKLSMHEVGSWLTPANMPTIVTKLGEAIKAAVPESSKVPTLPEDLPAEEVSAERESSNFRPIPVSE